MEIFEWTLLLIVLTVTNYILKVIAKNLIEINRKLNN